MVGGKNVDDIKAKSTSGKSEVEAKAADGRKQWMNGRAVYRRPESRPSIVAQRDIVHSENEMHELAKAFVDSMKIRTAMTHDDVEAEILELDEYERSHSDGSG